MPESKKEMKKSKFLPGWDEHRVQSVLAHYESQSEEEAVAEDEAAYEDSKQTRRADAAKGSRPPGACAG